MLDRWPDAIELTWGDSATLYGVAFAGTASISTYGTPTAGTFRLQLNLGGHPHPLGGSWPGGDVQTTAEIAYNASASAIQTALRDLPAVNSGDITCTGGALGSAAVVVTFSGLLAGLDPLALTVEEESLTGGTDPTVEVSRSRQDLTGYTVRFIAKSVIADADADGYYHLFTGTGITTTSAANGEFTVAITPSDHPAALEAAKCTKLTGELQISNGAGTTVYTLARGPINVLGHYVRTAP